MVAIDWINGWTVVLAFSVVLSWRSDVVWWVKAPLIYVMAFGVLFGVSHNSYYSTPDMTATLLLKNGALFSSFVCALALWFFEFKSAPDRTGLIKSLGVVTAVIVLILIILSPEPTIHTEVPLMGNPSISASFAALSLSWPLALIAALWTQTATAGMLVFSYLTILAHRKFGWLALVISATLAASALYFADLNPGLRFEMWSQALDYWTEQPLLIKLFGLGPGSSAVVLPHIQQLNGTTDKWFYFLHNDWLQIIMELGLVGFTLIATCYAKLLYSVRYSNYLYFFVGFGLCMITSYPLHWAPHVLLGAVMVKGYLNEL